MSTYYKHWKGITTDKYILLTNVVKRGIVLNFNKDKSSKPLFKYPRIETENDMLQVEVY